MKRRQGNIFPKANRVLNRPDFLEAVRRGTRLTNHFFSVAILQREQDKPLRLGLSVTRKYGNAVQRNRAKRLSREVFRQRILGNSNIAEEAKGRDLVVLIKPPAAQLESAHFREQAETIFRQACHEQIQRRTPR